MTAPAQAAAFLGFALAVVLAALWGRWAGNRALAGLERRPVPTQADRCPRCHYPDTIPADPADETTAPFPGTGRADS